MIVPGERDSPGGKVGMAKNLCLKTRPASDPYEVWESADGSWRWSVLKKYQADDDKPYARWFCSVTSPFVGPSGELGDCYVTDVKGGSSRLTGDGRGPGEGGRP